VISLRELSITQPNASHTAPATRWIHHPDPLPRRRRSGRSTGVTIPSSGRVGWHFGTDRWPDDGEFFRFTITRYELLTHGTPIAGR
jgi:hypothetical protein